MLLLDLPKDQHLEGYKCWDSHQLEYWNMGEMGLSLRFGTGYCNIEQCSAEGITSMKYKMDNFR